jgi:hypothetical protein
VTEFWVEGHRFLWNHYHTEGPLYPLFWTTGPWWLWPFHGFVYNQLGCIVLLCADRCGHWLLETIYIIVMQNICNPENFQFTLDRKESKPVLKITKKKQLLSACATLRCLYINVDATKFEYSKILWKYFSFWVSIFVVWLKSRSSWIRTFVDFVFVPKTISLILYFQHNKLHWYENLEKASIH